MSLTWVKPPKDHRWGPISDELRAHPGQWAALEDVKDHVDQYAHRIRHGILTSFRPPGEFEAKVRGGQLLARYVGPPPDQES